MQRGLNQVTLQGNIGQDPEVREFGEGDKAGKIVNLTIATSTVWRKGTENQEKTEWHRVVVFGSSANFAAEYLRKGSAVIVVGMLQNRSYEDKDGITRYITEVVVQPMENGIIQPVGARNQDAGQAPARTQSAPAQTPAPAQAPAAPAQAPSAPPVEDDTDDDIPF